MGGGRNLFAMTICTTQMAKPMLAWAHCGGAEAPARNLLKLSTNIRPGQRTDIFCSLIDTG